MAKNVAFYIGFDCRCFYCHCTMFDHHRIWSFASKPNKATKNLLYAYGWSWTYTHFITTDRHVECSIRVLVIRHRLLYNILYLRFIFKLIMNLSERHEERYFGDAIFELVFRLWCHGVRSYRSDDDDDDYAATAAIAVTCDFDRNAAKMKKK